MDSSRYGKDKRAMIESIENVVGVLEIADPQKKAALYESLGLALGVPN